MLPGGYVVVNAQVIPVHADECYTMCARSSFGRITCYNNAILRVQEVDIMFSLAHRDICASLQQAKPVPVYLHGLYRLFEDRTSGHRGAFFHHGIRLNCGQICLQCGRGTLCFLKYLHQSLCSQVSGALDMH